MGAAITGALLVCGLLVFLHGAFPKKANLAGRLAEFNDQEFVTTGVGEASLLESMALTMLETVKGADIDAMRSDLAITDGRIEEIAIEKLKAAGGGAALVMSCSAVFGWVSGGVALLMVGLFGAAAGYILPDFELHKKAEARRVDFSRTLTAFITLLGSSISGGGGITTAMNDAAAMGEGWVFIKLRGALEEAHLNGTSPWNALDQLGRELRVVSLIELAGSLTLAGNSGARVTETLHSRAESSRKKELSDSRSAAEAKSSSLGAPVGLMLVGWAGFMGYPAVTSLLGGLA